MGEDPAEPELPRAVALAWGVAANPQRGPKRELSIERIVEVAVQLADAGGLASVSMAAVAASSDSPRCRCTATSARKTISCCSCRRAGSGCRPSRSARPRDRRLARRAARLGRRTARRLCASTPGCSTSRSTSMPITPNNLAWFDAGLDALAATPL